MKKSKKILGLALLSCMVLIPTSLTFASETITQEEQADQDFVIENGVLVKYNGTAEHVIIPNTVTEIGAGAFSSSDIKSIEMPNTVKKMGEGAFRSCQNLEEITLPNQLKKIEKYLFWNCSKLTKVIIPDSVTFIDKYSFWGCDALETLDIPKSVKRVDGSFTESPWLQKKQEENPLVIINGNVVNGEKCVGEVTIPKGVTRISSDAFKFNRNITAIIIPNTVTAIGEGAFNSCTYLTQIEIPNSVKYMGIHIFERCTRLKKVKLSEKLEVIPEGIFWGCKNLKQLTIPKSVKKIERSAFENCNKLQDIVMSSNVKECASYSFMYPEGIVLHAPKGSYIEKLAKEEKVAFESLAINKKSISLKVNKTASLHVGTDTTFTTWKSSNSGVAKVSKTGKVTAKKKGTATITGTLYGKKYTCKVVVK